MIEKQSLTKEMRFRVSTKLWTRYKILCLKNKLSIPRQTAELIRKFVEIQELNSNILDRLKEK